MSAGPIALIGWLAVASLFGILLAAAVIWAAHIVPDDSPPYSFGEAAWQTLMRTIDPGTVGGDVGWAFRIIAILVTFWGIFFVSSLIGLLTTGVQERLDELRKGRSRVLDRGHTLILNWSPAVFDIIHQLSMAAADERSRRVVAVLAPRDKVEMEGAITERAFPRVRVMCRSGDPTDLRDLAMVNVEDARAVIVVSPKVGDPDARNIKTLLALTQATNTGQSQCRLVAEFRDTANVEAVRAMGAGRVQAIMADDLISRIIVHASRQSGLSVVYAELLDYAGMEFHIVPLGAAAGTKFSEALNMFNEASLIGLCVGDKVTLNPSMDTVIEPDALGVFIAQNRRAVRALKSAEAVNMAAINTGGRITTHAERAIILGWNRLGPTVASELSCYMMPNSVLTIVANEPGFAEAISKLSVENTAVRVEHVIADPTSRNVIRQLDPAASNHVIVLACDENFDQEAADARTLVSLMHLRQAVPENAAVTIVSEVLDDHSRAIAKAMRADDFVVSNRLVSLMLT